MCDFLCVFPYFFIACIYALPFFCDITQHTCIHTYIHQKVDVKKATRKYVRTSFLWQKKAVRGGRRNSDEKHFNLLIFHYMACGKERERERKGKGERKNYHFHGGY